MLLYNTNKEFIGIDESYLKVFGLSDLTQLRAEAADFADLFVKAPGYVHNFKHVHWIDFITCGESFEKPKVIINVHSNTYTAKITINTFYLTDNPSSKAYAVRLNDLRALSSQENANISDELLHKPIPTPVSKEEFTPAPEPVKERVIPESYSVDIEDDDNQGTLVEDSIELPGMKLDNKESLQEEEDILEYADETSDSDYVFDPQVASNELGLPIDLIEEFMEDFIAQAKDFKEELYASLSEDDIENVKILSHKLKGVAANLRVEDAFNHLSVVNTSTDSKEIELELNSFYRIISKLAGEEIAPKIPKVSKPKAVPANPEPVNVEEPDATQEDESDTFALEFKDEVTQAIEDDSDKLEIQESESLPNMDFAYDIEDEDVPEKIDLPQLADDDFVAMDSAPKEMKLDLMDDISIDDIEEEKNKPLPDDFLIDDIKSEIEEEDLGLELIEDKVVEHAEPITEIQPEPIVVEYAKKQIAGEIGLDMETFDELLEDYVTDTSSLLSSMKEAVLNDNFAKCKQDVLVLKGMSDSMHVKAIEDEIGCLMHSSDKNEMTDAIDTIENVIEQISK